MKEKIQQTLARIGKALSGFWRDKALPWLKAALAWCKEKGSAFLRAIPPTVSRGIRAVEGFLQKQLNGLSRRTQGDAAAPQRVSRPLLFLVLAVMCVVMLAGLVLTIVLGARVFACVCHPASRGSEPVAVLETPIPVTPPPLATPAPTIDPEDTYLGGVVFKRGDKDETIAVVQQRLMDLNYIDSDEPTENFGPVTESALKLFQQRNGLDPTGILDEAVYTLLFSDNAVAYVMQVGDSGDSVEAVQERLYELGYMEKSDVTGNYGERTEAAVIAFQTANKLTADGLVGIVTSETLYAENVVGNVFKSGDSDESIKGYQERLQELGYLGDSYKITGKMDSKTVSAIKEFQDANGLVRDGVLGPATIAVLHSDDALKYALRLGMSGSKVKDAQRLLRKLGYLTSSEVTGYFDDITEDAVRLFQKRNNLSQDGAIGSKTLAKLNDSSAKRAPSTPTPKVTKKPTATPKVTPKPGSKATATPKATAKTKVTPTPKHSTAKTKVEKFISIAESKLGCPYVSGAKGPNKFDCSGFVYWCLNQAGVKQSYMTSIMWRKCTKYKRITSWGDFKRGDVMVFKGSTSSTGHVGIYLGNGKMIDAAHGAGEVRITSSVLSGSYWKQHFLMAYRIWD